LADNVGQAIVMSILTNKTYLFLRYTCY